MRKKEDRHEEEERRRLDLYIDFDNKSASMYSCEGSEIRGSFSREEWMALPMFQRWKWRDGSRFVSVRCLGSRSQ